MTEKEALEIIDREKLSVNWFKQHPQEPYETVIKISKDGMYQVYSTDERAGRWGVISEFSSLEEALDNLIDRERFSNSINKI